MIDTLPSKQRTRLYCLDNFRYISVLLIVVFHSTSAYVAARYIVMDPKSSPVTKIIGGILISVLLNMLFFAAGFFAIPSFEKKGLWYFLLNKLKHLGIPLVLGSVFIGPMLPYIGYWSQNFEGLESTSYRTFWFNYMKSFGHPGTTGGNISAEPVFYYQHYWFILALLSMFCLFAPMYALWKKITSTYNFRLIKTEALSNGSVLLVLFIFPNLSQAGNDFGIFRLFGPAYFILTIFVFFSLLLIYDPVIKFVKNLRHTILARHTLDELKSDWMRLTVKLIVAVILGIFVIFIGTYANRYGRTIIRAPGFPLYFLLGVYAYSKKWFINGTSPGSFIFWALVLFLCLAGQHTVLGELSFMPKINILNILSSQYLTIACIGLLSVITFRWMNKPSGINEKFAANSYMMYIIHFPIVASMQFMMLDWAIPVLLKFIICAVVSILVSFFISNYIIKPFPKWSVAGLVVIFVLMSVFLQPERSTVAAEEASIRETEESLPTEQPAKPSPADHERMIQGQLEYYDKFLDLTDEQKSKLTALLKMQIQVYETFNTQLEVMLTEEQLKKYHERRGGR
ncbi:MAG: acyltransferase family protein [Candidatus Latescibacteria bacterium]|nr:acyltransferase family protein [Candidatus Latescibacterota bacterium]